MDTNTHTTLPLFSGSTFIPPRDVERIWNGKDRHFAAGTTEPYDRVRCKKQLELDGGPASDSIIDRAVTRYGVHGRIQPGLLPKFPLLRDQQRPWLLPELADEPTELLEKLLWLCDQLQQRVENEGDLLNRARAVLHVFDERFHGTAIVAATALGAFRLLDMLSDGKVDNVINWCRLLLAPAHVHL
jgi:hypothetical protein